MARQTHWWLGCFVPWILVRNCAGCPVTRTADKPDKNRPGCLVFATLIKIEQLIKSWNHASFRPLIWWSPLHLEMQSLNHYCVTQLKLDTVEKLSSSIFCCLSVRHRCHPTKSPLFPIYTGIQALWWPNTIYKGIKALFWVTHSILGLVLYVCLSIQRLGYIGGIESPNKKGNCWTKHCEIIFFVKSDSIEKRIQFKCSGYQNPNHSPVFKDLDM